MMMILVTIASKRVKTGVQNRSIECLKSLNQPEIKRVNLCNTMENMFSKTYRCKTNDENYKTRIKCFTTLCVCVCLKGLKKLRRLYLDGNLLEVVPAGLPPTLQELKINENKLEGINKHSLQGNCLHIP